MEKLIINLITAIIGNVDSSINKVFNNLIDMCFNSEQYLINILDNQIISFTNLKAVILTFAISLIVLKFLKKDRGRPRTSTISFYNVFCKSIDFSNNISNIV